MVLEGDYRTAADINLMATDIQPLTRHMLLQVKEHGSETPSAADWQEFVSVAHSCEAVTSRDS